MKIMKTQEFLQTLRVHEGKSLLFEYAPNLLVGANYHITEVKHTTVDSVDCGGGVDFWKETIVQLYESAEELGKTEFMSVEKATEILDRVGSMKPYVLDAEIKIEYSNSNFHTAQLYVNGFEVRGNNLLVKLAVQPTDCKAKETCGIEPVAAESATQSCAPGSGCC